MKEYEVKLRNGDLVHIKADYYWEHESVDSIIGVLSTNFAINLPPYEKQVTRRKYWLFGKKITKTVMKYPTRIVFTTPGKVWYVKEIIK